MDFDDWFANDDELRRMSVEADAARTARDDAERARGKPCRMARYVCQALLWTHPLTHRRNPADVGIRQLSMGVWWSGVGGRPPREPYWI